MLPGACPAQGLQALLGARQVSPGRAVGTGLGRQQLGIDPVVIGVAHGLPGELNSLRHTVGQVIGEFQRLFRAFTFQQRVIQRGGVFQAVVGITIRCRKHTPIQVRGDFRLALVEVGSRHPAQGIRGNGHAGSGELLVFADHLCGARPGLESAQAVDAPAGQVVLGLRVLAPGGEQGVVVGQGTVGHHKALFLTAAGQLREAHPFGGEVGLDAPLDHRIDQPGVLPGQAQGRFRQARPLQGVDVFADDFGLVASADKRLVVCSQGVIRLVGAGQRVAQGQAPVRVIGLGRHQGLGPGHGFGRRPASAWVRASPSCRSAFCGSRCRARR